MLFDGGWEHTCSSCDDPTMQRLRTGCIDLVLGSLFLVAFFGTPKTVDA